METRGGTGRGVGSTFPVVGVGSSNGGTEEPEVRIDGTLWEGRECQREAPGTEQHPYQLREKKAFGSRRNTAHHIAIVGACPKRWASSQPVATRSMLMGLPHEQMHGQHAQMLQYNAIHCGILILQ